MGTDSGLGTPNGPCEWIDAADKGFGRSGGKSGYLTGFQLTYCSAALDVLAGGPGGSTVIGFRTGYEKGLAANAQGPSGTLAGSFLLTGLPAHTGCSSFFGGFSCFQMNVDLGNLPVCLPDGAIGWSWQFTDVGTDGVLAKTFPFLSCVQSCSGKGKDGQGMTDCVDRYCPSGGSINSSFSFSTAAPYFTSISISLNEAQAINALSVVCNGTGLNPVILSNTSSGAGGTVNAPILGQPWRVTLDCSSSPGLGKPSIFRVAFTPKPPPVLSQWGEILVATSGPGRTVVIPVSDRGTMHLGPFSIPKNLSVYGVAFSVQGFCPRTPGPGFLSNALSETVGSN